MITEIADENASATCRYSYIIRHLKKYYESILGRDGKPGEQQFAEHQRHGQTASRVMLAPDVARDAKAQDTQ